MCVFPLLNLMYFIPHNKKFTCSHSHFKRDMFLRNPFDTDNKFISMKVTKYPNTDLIYTPTTSLTSMTLKSSKYVTQLIWFSTTSLLSIKSNNETSYSDGHNSIDIAPERCCWIFFNVWQSSSLRFLLFLCQLGRWVITEAARPIVNLSFHCFCESERNEY